MQPELFWRTNRWLWPHSITGRKNYAYHGQVIGKKPRRFHRGFAFQICVKSSAAVIHVKLHRVRGHAVAVLFFLFQFDVAFDLVFGEDSAFEEEVVVGG